MFFVTKLKLIKAPFNLFLHNLFLNVAQII